MKRATLFIIISFLVQLGWSMLDINEAMERVRQFEGSPTLSLRYVGLDQELTWEETGGEEPVLPWPCYFIETVDKNRCYEVDPYTGQIVLWADRVAIGPTLDYDRQMGNRDISQMISPAQAYASAVNFIKSHDPGFNPDNYEVRVFYGYVEPSGARIGKFIEYNHSLSWSVYQSWISFSFQKVLYDAEQEKIPHLGDTISIEMDSETGNVYKYVRRNFQLNVSLVPEISRAQAEQIALGVFHSEPFSPYVSYAEVVRVNKGMAWVDVPPNCFAYVWVIDVNTYSDDPAYQEEVGAPYDPYGWKVTIDAHTGQVLTVESYLGAVGKGVSPNNEKIEKFKRASKVQVMPRIIKDSKPLFGVLKENGKYYITSGQAWAFAVVVEEKGKEVFLKKYNGEKNKLIAKEVIRKNGKVYVPLEEVLKIAGYEAKYVPNENAIYIKKVNKEKEKVKGAIGGTLSLSALSYALWKFLRILA